MPKPALKDICGRDRCGDPFGEHYLTHGEKKQGCAAGRAETNQYGDLNQIVPCTCTGFLMVWSPDTTPNLTDGMHNLHHHAPGTR